MQNGVKHILVWRTRWHTLHHKELEWSILVRARTVSVCSQFSSGSAFKGTLVGRTHSLENQADGGAEAP